MARCQFGARARLQAALGETGLLGLALQAALLLARLGQLALGLDHALVQLGVALLAVGQLHVELFKAAFGRDAALLQVFQLGIDLGQVGLRSARCGHGSARPAASGAARFHLQLMRAALAFGGFAAHVHQALRRVGVGRLGADQGAAGFFG
jgi:hypothetical protein